MPLSIPGTGVVLTDANFTNPLKSFVDGLESTVAAVSAVANSALTTAQAKYTKPAQGIPVSDLVTTGLVQTDGTVLQVVKLTQAAYDALGTKVATTLYVIVG